MRSLEVPAWCGRLAGRHQLTISAHFLQEEQLDSGAVLADAFPNLARLEEYSYNTGLTVQATSQLALAWTRAQSAADAWAQCGPRVSKACKLPLQAAVLLDGNSEVFSSKSLEDTSMETTLDQAVAVAWRVGVEAGLLRELRSELKNMREVDKMLRLIFLADPQTWWKHIWGGFGWVCGDLLQR